VMFKKKHAEEAAPPALEVIEAIAEAAEQRTTCYPKDEPAPPVQGQPRTTVYRQALGWNRGGYDTVN